MESSNKKELLVLILATKTSEPRAKDIDIAMIGIDTYCIAYYLKKAQMFVISMKNIQYQAEKEVKTKTNPKIVVAQESHDFLNVFSKKNSDTLLSYQKYDHKIYLKEK